MRSFCYTAQIISPKLDSHQTAAFGFYCIEFLFFYAFFVLSFSNSQFLNTALCTFFFMEMRCNGPAALLLPLSHLSPHWPVLSFCGCGLSIHFLRDHHTCVIKTLFFSLHFISKTQV